MDTSKRKAPVGGPTFTTRLILVLAIVACIAPQRQTLAQQPIHAAQGRLVVKDGQFLMDGHPYQILSGEIHFARIPRAYWRDRLKKAKAMGLNTVSVYVFWNLHEPKPGVFDFTGNLDVAEFVRIAQQEGLNVMLRPGPYVCAEWEFGGFPAWLIKDPGMVVRSNAPQFMEPAKRWLTRLGKELAPLQSSNGGPIIGVQLENEYGSYGSDKAYLANLRSGLIQAGFTSSLIYTVDGIDQLPKGTLPGMLALGNFGAGRAKENIEKLAKFEPGMPLMVGEYWVGWYDKWGMKHATVDQKKVVEEYEWMLDQGYSVSMYMFHGGTSFGFMNGANLDKSSVYSPGDYHPAVNSYDYNSPLDESGHPTKLYYSLRDIIARHNKKVNAASAALPPVPESSPAISIPEFSLTESASLWKSLPKPTVAVQPVNMEALDQSYGYVLYRTIIAKPAHGELRFGQIQDYAQIYLNGALVGTIDRRLHQDRLIVNIDSPNTQLDVIVENTGRVNYGDGILSEWKGIRSGVILAGNPVTNWKMYSLPMDNLETLKFSSSPDAGTASTSGPMFYRGIFTLDTPGDTYLDMRGLKKGVVWVNGHILSRFWDIGPQQTAYLPGAWLKSGKNTVTIFDLYPQPGTKLSGLNAPLLDGPVPEPATK